MLDLITSKCVIFLHTLSPENTVKGLFEITADTGIISVLSEIDREKTGDVVTLNVTVPISLTSVLFLFCVCANVFTIMEATENIFHCKR